MSVGIANVFVEFEAKLSGLFTAIDGIQTRLDKLTAQDFTINVSVDEKTFKAIERIGDAVEGLTNRIDRAEAVVMSFVDSLDGTMGNLSEQVSMASKSVLNDMSKVEAGVGHAFESISERITRVFNPRLVASGLTLSYALKLLVENGFNLRDAWGAFTSGGGSGPRMLTIFTTLGQIIRTRDWMLFANVWVNIKDVIFALVPRLFTMAGFIGIILASTRRLFDVFSGFLSRSPNSAILQFTQLLKVTSSGMFQLEEHVAVLLERTRLFVGVTVLLSTTLMNVIRGTTGWASALGPIVAIIDVSVTLFRIAAVKLSNFVLKTRASLGDGRAQLQLLFMALRQIYPIMQALAENAKPIAAAIHAMSKGGISNILTTALGTFDKLNRSLNAINKTLKQLIQYLNDGVPTALKRVDVETKKINKGSGSSGGSGGVLAAILPAGTGAGPTSVNGRVSRFYKSLTTSMKAATQRNQSVFRAITTGWFAGTLFERKDVLTSAIGKMFAAALSSGTAAPAIAHAVADSASSSISQGMAAAAIAAKAHEILPDIGGIARDAYAVPFVEAAKTSVVKSAIAAAPNIMQRFSEAVFSNKFVIAIKQAIAAKEAALVVALKSTLAKVAVTAAHGFMVALAGAMTVGFARFALLPLTRVIGSSFAKGFAFAFKESLDLPPGLIRTLGMWSTRAAGLLAAGIGSLFPEKLRKAFSATAVAVGQIGAGITRTLVAAIAGGFGRSGFAARQMQKAAENFNKSGLGPFVRNMLKGAGVYLFAGINDAFSLGGRAVVGLAKTAGRLGKFFFGKVQDAMGNNGPPNPNRGLFTGLGLGAAGGAAKDKSRVLDLLSRAKKLKEAAESAGLGATPAQRSDFAKGAKLEKLATKGSAVGRALEGFITEFTSKFSLISKIASGGYKQLGLFEPQKTGFISETENRKARQQSLNKAAQTAAQSLVDLRADAVKAGKQLSALREALGQSEELAKFMSATNDAMSQVATWGDALGKVEKAAATNIEASINAIEKLAKVETLYGGANTNKRRAAVADMQKSVDGLVQQQALLRSKTEFAAKYLGGLATELEKFKDVVPGVVQISEMLRDKQKTLIGSQDGVLKELEQYEGLLREIIDHSQKAKTKPLTSLGGALNLDAAGVVARAKGMIDSLKDVAKTGKTAGALFTSLVDQVRNSPAVGSALTQANEKVDVVKDDLTRLHTALSALLAKYGAEGAGDILGAESQQQLQAAVTSMRTGVRQFSGALKKDSKAAQDLLDTILLVEANMVQAAERQKATTDDMSGSENLAGQGNKELADALLKYSGALERMRRNTEGLENSTKTVSDTMDQIAKVLGITKRVMRADQVSVGRAVAARNTYTQALGAAAQSAGSAVSILKAGAQGAAMLSQSALSRTIVSLVKTVGTSGLGRTKNDVSGSLKPETAMNAIRALTSAGFTPPNSGKVQARDNPGLISVANALARLVAAGNDAHTVLRGLFEEIANSETAAGTFNKLVAGAVELDAAFEKGMAGPKALAETFKESYGAGMQLVTVLRLLKALGRGAAGQGSGFGIDTIIGRPGVLAKALQSLGAAKNQVRPLVAEIRNTAAKELATGLGAMDPAEHIVEKIIGSVQALLKSKGLAEIPLASLLGPQTRPKTAQSLAAKTNPIYQFMHAALSGGALPPEIMKDVASLQERVVKAFKDTAPSIAESIEKGNPDTILDALKYILQGFADQEHHSPPVGFVGDVERSFGLAGTTIAQELMKGLPNLVEGVNQFFQYGFGSVSDIVAGVLKAPIMLAQSIVQRGIGAIVGTMQGFAATASKILGVIPVVGTIAGALLEGVSRIFGALAEVLSRAIGLIGDAVVAMINTVTGAFTYLTDTLQETAEKIFQLGQEAKRANADVASFDLARRVFQQFGVDATEVAQSVSIMRQSLSQARRDGSGPLVASIELLGYQLDDIDKIKPAELFLRVAEALKSVNPSTEEYHNLLELVGGSLSNIRTALEDVDGLRRAMNNASGAALISDRDVAAAFALNSSLKIVDQFVEDLKKVSFSGLSTGLKPLIDLFNEKGPKFLGMVVSMMKSIATLGGGIIARITNYVQSRFGSGGFGALRRDGEALGSFLLARLKVYSSEATLWLMDQIDVLIKYGASVVGPFLLEISKKVAPLVVVILAGIVEAVISASAHVAAAVKDMIAGVVSGSLGESSKKNSERALKAMSDDAKARMKALADELGLMSFDTSGISEALRKVKDENSKAFSFDQLKAEAPELEKLMQDIANDVLMFGDAFEKAMKAAGSSADDQRKTIMAFSNAVRDMRGEAQLDLAVFSELSKRIADVGDQMTQLSEQFTIGARAAMDSRRALSSQVEGVVALRNKIKSVADSVQAQIVTVLTRRGSSSDVAAAIADNVRQLTLGSFGPELSTLIGDTLSQSLSPDAIVSKAGELEDRLQKFLQIAAGHLHVPPETLTANTNLRALFRGMLDNVRGVQKELAGLNEVTQKVQELTQGWSVSLIDVGANAKLLDLQFAQFSTKINTVFDTLDALSKESGQSAAKKREFEIQKSIVEEVARQLGLEKATREEVLKRAADMTRLQKVAAQTTAAYNAFQAVHGTIDQVTGTLGSLASIFTDVDTTAAGTELSIAKMDADLRAMLTNNDKLLGVFQKWFNVTGDIEQSVTEITKQIRAAAEAAKEVQALQAAFDAFSKFDEIFRNDADPFEALKDQMGDARKEAYSLGLQLKATAAEGQAFIDGLAKRAPAKLVELAKNLEATGHVEFTVDLDEAHAVQIAQEIGAKMREAIQERLHNIQIKPLVDTIRSDLAGPVVSGFTDVMKGLADGTIHEAARTAREQARQAKIHFSEALYTVAQIGKGIFDKALDSFMSRFTERLTDGVTKGLISAIESSEVFGAVGKLSDSARNMIGQAASGLVAAMGLILSKLQRTASTVSSDIQSAVQSTEAVRGVISGATNVALKDVGAQLKEANRGIESRLDRILLAILDYTGNSALAAPASPLADVILTSR